MSRSPDEAQRFLSALAGTGPVTFQTFADTGAKGLARVLPGTLAQHRAELTRLNAAGAGVYVMVNEGDGRGRKASNVRRVRAFFVDLDGAPLAPVESAPLPPHLIVQTSEGRYQAYWLVKDCPPAAFSDLQHALAERFDADKSVKDLPRVMRVPGFMNRKRAEPFPVVLISAADFPPYAVEQVREAFGIGAVPAPLPEARVAQPSPVLKALMDAGLYREPTQTAGMHYVRCPNYDIHGVQNATQTAWWEPYYGGHEHGGFKCFDAVHCADNFKTADLLRWLRQRGHLSDGEAAREIEFKSSTALAAQDLPEVKLFVPHLLPAGLTLIAGRAKLGKSWLMLSLARAISTGSPFLGQKTRAARVLYLALEDNDRRLKSRMEKLGMADVEFTYSTRAPRMDQDLIGQLCRAIEKQGFEVIIIDTLAAIAPTKRNANGVWAGDYDTISALQRDLASKHNVAVVVITHTKKNADSHDAQDAIVTTTGILAGADAYWVFQKKPGHMLLTVTGRDIEGDEYALRFEKATATWAMLGKAENVVTSKAQRGIIAVLEASGEALAWRELKTRSALGPNFDASLARLVERGSVEKDKQGRYRLAQMGALE